MKDKRIQILRDLGTGVRKPAKTRRGACWALMSFFSYKRSYKTIEQLAPTWPEFSGNIEYPVPHPTLDPEKAYVVRKQLWRNDAYGNARRRLCLFLADELERLEKENAKTN